MQVDNISEKLKKIRLNKGLTIESISNILNVSKQGYSLWEQQKRNWNIDTLVKLSSILDFEMTIKDGKIIILENSSDDYIDICSDEESNEIIKNQLQNKTKDEDINNENIENIHLENNLIKKIKHKNILKKYPLCNYLLEKQTELFLEYKRTFINLYITKDEIENISKQKMNYIKTLQYLENQTEPYLIIYDYIEQGYKIITQSLFYFNADNPNIYDGTYFSIGASVMFNDEFLKSGDEYKNAIIISINNSEFQSKHNHLHQFLIVASKFINKDIDTLDKDTYKNTLKFKINFKELKECFENENTKYDNYLEFKSNVITKIIREALNYDLEVKFKERNENENIILDFEIIY